MVSCAGTSSEAPQEGQGHTEATTKDQTRSSEATASEEEARCEGTRTHQEGRIYYRGHPKPLVVTTNDLPDCPKGGLLLGTDKSDTPYSQPGLPGLDGHDGDDEIRGLGGSDYLEGGSGDDVLYGGDGDDKHLIPNKGDDVIYGGDGNDILLALGGQRDKLYCGEGKDRYLAGKKEDYVDSSCEKKAKMVGQVD